MEQRRLACQSQSSSHFDIIISRVLKAKQRERKERYQIKSGGGGMRARLSTNTNDLHRFFTSIELTNDPPTIELEVCLST